MNKKKRAFTLTELLVVVIVIGILAAVVLPKFSKVVETRKTTEAEEVMAAIRTEQEKRCLLNQRYTNSSAEVANLVPNMTTKNFTYNLNASGMVATSRGSYNYALQMPSYADGRICCQGDECDKLNKDYPACNDAAFTASLTTDDSCTAELVCFPDADGTNTTRSCGSGGTQTRSCNEETRRWTHWSACSEPTTEIQCTDDGDGTSKSCGCRNEGTQTRTCDTSTGSWSEWSECSISDVCTCTGEAQSEQQSCAPAGFEGTSCGTQSRTQTCNTTNGEWTYDGVEWGSCTGACECTPGQVESTHDGCSGTGYTHTRTCNSDGTWGEYGACERTCTYGVSQPITERCTPNNSWEPSNCGTRTMTCQSNNRWSGFGQCSTAGCCRKRDKPREEMKCWYCCEYAEAIQPLGPRSALPVEQNGYRFSFYYALGEIESCTSAANAPSPQEFGSSCMRVCPAGSKLICQPGESRGTWVERNQACSELFPTWCGSSLRPHH